MAIGSMRDASDIWAEQSNDVEVHGMLMHQLELDSADATTTAATATTEASADTGAGAGAGTGAGSGDGKLWKLLVGRVAQSMWTGPQFPNARWVV